uniref:Dof-type domain-containing protein n=1 Tax=Ananas comosus var. bracteatus TaxID=296719 RepID=A0A6V7P346_ANACO|nr:unnamed protein product [Ananas comosus var. bracteatus]
MEERRDQAIKLFGKMIPLQGSGEDSIGAGEEENKLQQRVPEKQLAVQSISLEKIDPLIPPPTKSENGAKPEAKEAENEKQRKPNGDQDEETAARKPDKIVPCPRCDSLDTKFCYFNNYNVSQPRHFCKNCQRYWTAGGSLRNVPVGAGRRKTNKSFPCYRGVNLSPAHPTAVLSFGSDSPLCESMASVLNLESCEDQNSSQSSMTGSSSTTDDGTGTASAAAAAAAAVVAQIPCVNGFPWAYPTSPASASAFAFPLYYPAVAYWGYTVPLHPPQHNSPALGKHSREGDKLDDAGSEKSCEEKRFWIPKTLRIDDPEAAARSSIWATIGFKNEKSSAVCGGGLFKPFRSKDDCKKSTSERPQVLQANPAAFARSMNFRESS